MPSTCPPSFTHYARMIWDVFNPAADRAITIGLGDLHLVPVQVWVDCTIEALGFVSENPVSDNVRMGLYEDNGDTPVGGALVVQATMAPVVDTKNEMAASARLDAGLYWLAFIPDGNCDVEAPAWQTMQGGTLVGYWSDNLGYGVLPDPCPSLEARENQPCTYLLVASIP